MDLTQCKSSTKLIEVDDLTVTFSIFRLRDWSQREAYLLVREREAKGLPLLDPNYVEVSKIVLPSEEELGDFEIII